MPDGSFNFREVDGGSLFGYQEYEHYIELINQAQQDKDKTGFTLEGLVVSEEGDINLIFRTEEISLPNLTEIEAILQEVDAKLPENKCSGNDLAMLIQEFGFTNTSRKDNDKLVALIEELEALGSNELDKNSFRKLINEKLRKTSNIAGELRNYLLSEHQIRFSFSKTKESLEDLLDSSLNIKYFGETEKEAYYLVGNSKASVQDSFKDGFHFRKIIAVNGSKLVFRQLLPTMDVDFVRTGKSTVLPFPFKYIREYKDFKRDE